MSRSPIIALTAHAMLGDREKCIQAQMDVSHPCYFNDRRRLLTTTQEYLSKPLKQNLLIQTILKCTTLGGALLERSNEVLASATDGPPALEVVADDAAPMTPADGGSQIKQTVLQRPVMDSRSFTSAGPPSATSLKSPSGPESDQPDPIGKVRSNLTSMTCTDLTSQFLLRSLSG